ncbi:MAG: hypothetical protein CMI67_25560 [Pelagibaca sp.]|nr:hypothetical protein [Pelagibaca sp.]
MIVIINFITRKVILFQSLYIGNVPFFHQFHDEVTIIIASELSGTFSSICRIYLACILVNHRRSM